MRATHQTQHLASLGPCTIEQCDCGVLHVTVGAVTMRVQPETARALVTVLDRALMSPEIIPMRFAQPATVD